jgi:hypothetical protein
MSNQPTPLPRRRGAGLLIFFMVSQRLWVNPPLQITCGQSDDAMMPHNPPGGGGGFIDLFHGVPKIVGEPAPTNSLWPMR